MDERKEIKRFHPIMDELKRMCEERDINCLVLIGTSRTATSLCIGDKRKLLAMLYATLKEINGNSIEETKEDIDSLIYLLNFDENRNQNRTRRELN